MTLPKSSRGFLCVAFFVLLVCVAVFAAQGEQAKWTERTKNIVRLHDKKEYVAAIVASIEYQQEDETEFLSSMHVLVHRILTWVDKAISSTLQELCFDSDCILATLESLPETDFHIIQLCRYAIEYNSARGFRSGISLENFQGHLKSIGQGLTKNEFIAKDSQIFRGFQASLANTGTYGVTSIEYNIIYILQELFYYLSTDNLFRTEIVSRPSLDRWRSFIASIDDHDKFRADLSMRFNQFNWNNLFLTCFNTNGNFWKITAGRTSCSTFVIKQSFKKIAMDLGETVKLYQGSKTMKRLTELQEYHDNIVKTKGPSAFDDGKLHVFSPLKDEWIMTQAFTGFIFANYLIHEARFHFILCNFQSTFNAEWIKDQTTAQWLVDYGVAINSMHENVAPFVQAAKYLAFFRSDSFNDFVENHATAQRKIDFLRLKKTKSLVYANAYKHSGVDFVDLSSVPTVITPLSISGERIVFEDPEKQKLIKEYKAIDQVEHEHQWLRSQYETLLKLNKAQMTLVNTMDNELFRRDVVFIPWTEGIIGSLLRYATINRFFSRNMLLATLNHAPSIFTGNYSCRALGDVQSCRRFFISAGFGLHSAQSIFERSFVFLSSLQHGDHPLHAILNDATEELGDFPYPLLENKGEAFDDLFHDFISNVTVKQANQWKELYQLVHKTEGGPFQDIPTKLIYPYAHFNPTILRLYIDTWRFDLEPWTDRVSPDALIDIYDLDQIIERHNKTNQVEGGALSRIFRSFFADENDELQAHANDVEQDDPKQKNCKRDVRIFPAIQQTTEEGKVYRVETEGGDTLLVSSVKVDTKNKDLTKSKFGFRCGFDEGSTLTPFTLEVDAMIPMEKDRKENWPQIIDRQTDLWNRLHNHTDPSDLSTINLEVDRSPDYIAPERYALVQDEKETFVWMVKDVVVAPPNGAIQGECGLWTAEHYLMFYPPYYYNPSSPFNLQYDEALRFNRPSHRLRKAFPLNSFYPNYFHFVLEDLSRLSLIMEMGGLENKKTGHRYPIFNDQTTASFQSYYTHSDAIQVLVPLTGKGYVNQSLFLLGFNSESTHYFPNGEDLTRPHYTVDQLYTVQWQYRDVKNLPQTYSNATSLMDQTLDRFRSLSTSQPSSSSSSSFKEYFGQCMPMLGYDLHFQFMPPTQALRLLQKRMLHNAKWLNDNHPGKKFIDEAKKLTPISPAIPLDVKVVDFEVSESSKKSVLGADRNLIVYTQRKNNDRRTVDKENLYLNMLKCVLSNSANDGSSNPSGKPVALHVHTGAEPFLEQVETFSRALVIFGPFGSGLNNAIWSSEGTSVVQFPRRHAIDNSVPSLVQAMNQFVWVVPSINATESGSYHVDDSNTIDVVKTVMTSLYTTSQFLLYQADPVRAHLAQHLDDFVLHLRSLPMPLDQWPFSASLSCLHNKP